MALAAQVVGDGEYPMVVVVGRHGGRKALGGLVVQLDPQRPALLVGGQGLGERAVLQAQPFEMAQGVAGRPAQLGVVALPLQFHQHHDRQHDGVLVEAHERTRVRQQDRRVEHVGPWARVGRNSEIGHVAP